MTEQEIKQMEIDLYHAESNLEIATQLITRLESALDLAITGLEWWAETYPQGIGKEDDDKIAEWKKLITK